MATEEEDEEDTRPYHSRNPEPWHEVNDSLVDVTPLLLDHWSKRSRIRGKYPFRKIVFQLTSHDQGWASDRGGHGTYETAYTWFDVGLERIRAVIEGMCEGRSNGRVVSGFLLTFS